MIIRISEPTEEAMVAAYEAIKDSIPPGSQVMFVCEDVDVNQYVNAPFVLPVRRVLAEGVGQTRERPRRAKEKGEVVMKQGVEQKIVMMNLVQCWQCKQYLPPGAEIRSRVMKTGVLTGRREQLTQYEPVSLCVTCDDAVAEQEKQDDIRAGDNVMAVGRIIGMGIVSALLYSLGWPAPIAIIATIGLLWYGILGRSLVALFVTVKILEPGIDATAPVAVAIPVSLGVIAAMFATTCSRRLFSQSNLPAEGEPRSTAMVGETDGGRRQRSDS
jgi:hypothetical protein